MLDSSARLTGLLCGTQPMNDIWSPRATLQRMLDVEAALARRPYLAGDTFTIGDIPVGINAYRWFLLDVERPKSPAIEGWVERLKARPAFAKTIVPPGNPNVALRL